MTGKMFPPVSQAAFSVGGQHLTGTRSCKARNPATKPCSPPPQRTTFPTKKDFAPTRQHPPIYACVVLRGRRSGRLDLPGHETAGSAGRGKAAQGSLLYLHPNSPSNFTAPILAHPISPAPSEKKEF
ncbi:hypothetical protein MRX96_028376 [Rhipicephalus microplus]